MWYAIFSHANAPLLVYMLQLLAWCYQRRVLSECVRLIDNILQYGYVETITCTRKLEGGNA